MKFYKTSFFNNFGASYFSHFIENKFIKQIISKKQEETIRDCIKNSKYEQLCLLGLNFEKSIDNINTVEYTFPDNYEDNKDKDLNFFIDSWLDTTQRLFNKFEKKSTLFVMSSNFFSFLEDPRPLLMALKRLSFENKIGIIFIEDIYNGYRKWNKNDINSFFTVSGFNIQFLKNQTYLITCDKEYYANYLEKFGIDSELYNSNLLYLTTEDASIKPTGGIGTYIKNIKTINPNVVILFCDLNFNIYYKSPNTFFPKDFIKNIENDNFEHGIGLIETIKSLLYLLPNINIIEFQDYQAIGFRVVQAKKTGVLPSNLWLRLFMHGGIDYVKYGFQDSSSNYSYEELSIAVKENYIAKNVDQSIAPSRYLGEQIFQKEFGHEVNNLSIKKLPFDLALLGERTKLELSNITQIVYIGKYINLKGWPDFIEAIKDLNSNNKLSAIKNIYSLSPGKPRNKEIDFLKTVSKYKYLHLTHDELIEFIKKNKTTTLFVVSSRGESYSFVILEQLLLGTLFIAYNTGGSIEAVDDEGYVKKYFCNPNPKALAQKIDDFISNNNFDISEIQSFSEKIYKRQIDINDYWLSETKSEYKPKINSISYDKTSDGISVVIPVFNTPINYVHELLESIKFSTIKPFEVILVNDGSEDSYLITLKELLATNDFDLKINLISQDNKGLAGARNTGLRNTKTKYAFFIDSDDILLPNTLKYSWISMNLDDDLICTTGYSLNFENKTELKNNLEKIVYGDFWKPLGISEARSLSLFNNQYITACTMVRKDELLSFGGWDESDRSTWEDYALYTKLAWDNKKLILFPWVGYAYRNTPGSMSKNYNTYFGQRRIIRNMDIFSKLDSNVIINLIKNRDIPSNISLNELKLIKLKRKMSNLFFYKIIKNILKAKYLRPLFIFVFKR